MSRKPEHVVTGVHLGGVQFWARVLVSPDRLSQVKESILGYGFAHLKRGERLEVETQCGDERSLAIVVGSYRHFDSRSESGQRGRCLVSWNEIAGEINIYGDDQDRLAALHGPVVDALCYRDRASTARWIDEGDVTSIQVGDVQVFFDRPDVIRRGIRTPFSG